MPPENNGNSSNINGDGNHIIQEIHNHYGIARKEVEDIINNALRNHLVLSKLEESRKAKLIWDYMTCSIDMDAAIKDVYKKCYKICANEIANNESYRTVKNLIDVVDRLTIGDIEYLKSLATVQHTGAINFSDKKFIKLKNLGLLDSGINQDYTNTLIRQELNGIHSIATGDGRSHARRGLTNNNFVIMYANFTLEGSLLYKIVKDNSGSEITDDLLNEISEMLKTS